MVTRLILLHQYPGKTGQVTWEKTTCSQQYTTFVKIGLNFGVIPQKFENLRSIITICTSQRYLRFNWLNILIFYIYSYSLMNSIVTIQLPRTSSNLGKAKLRNVTANLSYGILRMHGIVMFLLISATRDHSVIRGIISGFYYSQIWMPCSQQNLVKSGFFSANCENINILKMYQVYVLFSSWYLLWH